MRVASIAIILITLVGNISEIYLMTIVVKFTPKSMRQIAIFFFHHSFANEIAGIGYGIVTLIEDLFPLPGGQITGLGKFLGPYWFFQIFLPICFSNYIAGPASIIGCSVFRLLTAYSINVPLTAKWYAIVNFIISVILFICSFATTSSKDPLSPSKIRNLAIQANVTDLIKDVDLEMAAILRHGSVNAGTEILITMLLTVIAQIVGVTCNFLTHRKIKKDLQMSQISMSRYAQQKKLTIVLTVHILIPVLYTGVAAICCIPTGVEFMITGFVYNSQLLFRIFTVLVATYPFVSSVTTICLVPVYFIQLKSIFIRWQPKNAVVVQSSVAPSTVMLGQ